MNPNTQNPTRALPVTYRNKYSWRNVYGIVSTAPIIIFLAILVPMYIGPITDPSKDLAPAIIGTIFLFPFIFIPLRIIGQKVKVSNEGIRVKKVVKNSLTPWNDIQSFAWNGQDYAGDRAVLVRKDGKQITITSAFYVSDTGMTDWLVRKGDSRNIQIMSELNGFLQTYGTQSQQQA